MEERAEVARRVEELRDRDVCPTCYDLESGGALFGRGERVISEDDKFLIALETFPRMRGHTIVVFKPHREDLSELREDEAGLVMTTCLRVVRALKAGLGAKKVYMNTMCDGGRNHLHLQLFPRYEGEEVGSRRFVLPREPAGSLGETAALVREYLAS